MKMGVSTCDPGPRAPDRLLLLRTQPGSHPKPKLLQLQRSLAEEEILILVQCLAFQESSCLSVNLLQSMSKLSCLGPASFYEQIENLE